MLNTKKLVTLGACGVMALGLMAGCSSNSSSTEGSSDSSTEQTEQATQTEQLTNVEMKYTTADELKAMIDENDADLLIVDVRKAADYETSHIPGAVNADMDAAKGGDTESGIANMTKALEDATGSATADGKKIVLVCYSGKSYAQAGTDALANMGADMDNVTTLEGGMKSWEASYADVLEK